MRDQLKNSKIYTTVTRLIVFLILIVTIISYFFWSFFISTEEEPIRVGVLHALDGSMSVSERPLVESIRVAVEEVNRSGGILGRRVELVIANTKSDWDFAAKEARRLLQKEKVEIIFGCWTSSCRKAVIPVLKEFDAIMFYPLQYEGMESSQQIIYTGSTPNQQIIPATIWGLKTFGKRIFLLGSDYIFPRVANLIINEVAQIKDASIVGESYLKLGTTDVETVIDDIISSKPDLILNTINGDTNYAFFKALSQRFPKAPPPVISFSIGEPEIRIEPAIFSGHYASWSYFSSLEGPKNQEFIKAFKAYDTSHANKEISSIGDPMEASYIGFQLWKQAVEESKSTASSNIRAVLNRLSLHAPQGIVSFDPTNQHLWRTARIGQINPRGTFDIRWTSGEPVRPSPFPSFRHRQYWIEQLAVINRENSRAK